MFYEHDRNLFHFVVYLHLSNVGHGPPLTNNPYNHGDIGPILAFDRNLGIGIILLNHIGPIFVLHWHFDIGDILAAYIGPMLIHNIGIISDANIRKESG